jgi:hypothetical protein
MLQSSRALMFAEATRGMQAIAWRFGGFNSAAGPFREQRAGGVCSFQ